MVTRLLCLVLLMTLLAWLVHTILATKVLRRAVAVPLAFLLVGGVLSILYFNMEKFL